MTRVDELQKKYPTVPRYVILKTDFNVHGIRDWGNLEETGIWSRYAGLGTYATYDLDITLKEWVEMGPGRVKPGMILRPGRFVFPETGTDIMPAPSVNTKSDLTIRAEGSGKYAVYQGDERVDEVYQMPAMGSNIVAKEQLTKSGKPTSNFVHWSTKCCFQIIPVRFCEFFTLGMACKFCNFNPSQDDAASIGLQRSTTINLDEAVEAYKMRAAEVTVLEGHSDMGAIAKSGADVKIYAKFLEKIASATRKKPNLFILGVPTSRKDMQRLKDAGLDCIAYQMEMWDADLFEETVPGKAHFVGRDRYLEACEEAVQVFGVGNVGVGFVGGLNMIPENGRKTWQESRDSMVEGINWMIKRGVWPTTLYLRLPPGAAYATEENRKKMPPNEYYLELFLAHLKAAKETGLVNKWNRLMWCPLDCLTNEGAMAAYDQNGSVGKWAAAAVPRELNWLLDWEEQHRVTIQPK
ncbi:MAG: hypothetical protein HYX94_09125 [Chloroflexi bacterium]|nr:hypothetical protein [Chloroflexota bacterium]